jgi:hypothetical protein
MPLRVVLMPLGGVLIVAGVVLYRLVEFHHQHPPLPLPDAISRLRLAQFHLVEDNGGKTGAGRTDSCLLAHAASWHMPLLLLGCAGTPSCSSFPQAGMVWGCPDFVEGGKGQVTTGMCSKAIGER